jgi:hypothetical protein
MNNFSPEGLSKEYVRDRHRMAETQHVARGVTPKHREGGRVEPDGEAVTPNCRSFQ